MDNLIRKTKFAFLPKKIGGIWVWWEPYNAFYVQEIANLYIDEMSCTAMPTKILLLKERTLIPFFQYKNLKQPMGFSVVGVKSINGDANALEVNIMESFRENNKDYRYGRN